jgi:hypothetical protein
MFYGFNFMIDDFDNLNQTCDYYEYEYKYDYKYELSNYSALSDETFKNSDYIDTCVDVLIVFFVTSTSLLFSILIVSICVYEKMINQFVEKYNAHRECYDYDTYFFEYLDEFNELNNVKLDDTYLDLLEYKYVKQKTPKGEVLMNYNHSTSSFDYYCKKSNSIDFLYLDVVSRIYVVKYNCKNIYVDNYDNFELIKTYYANITNDLSSLDELKENTIFYNNIKKNKTKQSIEYVSNKYKYRGTFDDFNSYCKNNNHKIHTNDLLENDVFVLETGAEQTIVGDYWENCGEICEQDVNDYNNISFKSFKSKVAMSSKN